MKAASLFLVLLVAHLLMIASRSVPVSIWTLPAYLWQDLLTALVFVVIERVVRQPRIVWTLYGLLVLYSAINVPIARVLSSPLTWSMMRAARGPLSDSITYYLTAPNVSSVLLVIAAGSLFPWILKRTKFQLSPTGAIIAGVLIVAGPFAVTRIETSGFHRNAFGALWPGRVIRTEVNNHAGLRISPFATESPRDNLAQYRGSAAGSNVVLIALESTAAQYLKLYGADMDPMPNLTRLADHSIIFERAYTVYPESIKGLLSVLCSQYPALDRPAETYTNMRTPCIAQALTEAGYRTALFHAGRFGYLGMEAVVENRGFQTLEDAGKIGGKVDSSFGVDEPAVVDRMLRWIDERSQQKFFITYLPIAGHHPYATPERGPFSTDTDFGNYLNALHYGDAAIGKLIQGLRDRGLAQNTLLILYGDHGEAFTQHEGNVGHSMFIYEENVRVPFLIASEKLFTDPLRVKRTASLIDTAPTILDLLGLPLPEQFQGTSLLGAPSDMALFFTDYSLKFLGLRDACWKYIYEIDSDRSRLHDVCIDPDEKLNVAARERVRVSTYRDRVRNWIGSAGDR